jgi:hypothetical protein
MDGEWRVTLIVRDQPNSVQQLSAGAVRDLLRSRAGEEFSVTTGKAGMLLYAATEDAAGAAERTAREVLAEQGLAVNARLERWDPSRGAWLGVRPGDATTAELPSGHERNPGRRRMRFAGALIGAIIESIADNWP